MDAAVEKSAMRKIYLRLLPFAVLSYILAYIDRINVSFAGLTMRADLNLSATDFGFALGTFFLGYFVFEVPSNVIMEKVGADLDCAHHDHMGNIRRHDGVRLRYHEFLHRTLPARRGRGRLLSGDAALLYVLVPAQTPRPHRFRVPGGPADCRGARCTDLDGVARSWRPIGTEGLANHV